MKHLRHEATSNLRFPFDFLFLTYRGKYRPRRLIEKDILDIIHRDVCQDLHQHHISGKWLVVILFFYLYRPNKEEDVSVVYSTTLLRLQGDAS